MENSVNHLDSVMAVSKEKKSDRRVSESLVYHSVWGTELKILKSSRGPFK